MSNLVGPPGHRPEDRNTCAGARLAKNRISQRRKDAKKNNDPLLVVSYWLLVVGPNRPEKRLLGRVLTNN